MSDRITVDEVIRALARPFIENRDGVLILLAGVGLGFMLGILLALEIGVIEYQAVDPAGNFGNIENFENIENMLRVVAP